jgi:hypothetical protein
LRILRIFAGQEGPESGKLKNLHCYQETAVEDTIG